jgi:CRISPR/Cas system-associated endonuclease/helicase Cas3
LFSSNFVCEHIIKYNENLSHDIKLSLFPLALLENFDYLRDLVSREVKQVSTRDDHSVPCVLILNSVLDAVSISRVLQVSQIHGLIPKNLRKIAGDVVVGTSAIELGIDFQAHSVIFEGTDSASFLQRFGRAGRHFEGCAIGFVPARILARRIGNSFARGNFEEYTICQKAQCHILCIFLWEF